MLKTDVILNKTRGEIIKRHLAVIRKEARTRSPSHNRSSKTSIASYSSAPWTISAPWGQSLFAAPCLDPEFCSARGLACVQVEMKTPQTTGGSPASLLLLLLLLSGVCIDAYKPVIIVHGIFDGPKEFKTQSLFITKVGHLKSEHVQIRFKNDVGRDFKFLIRCNLNKY